MRVLYQDNHLFAVAKPPGLLTQPSGGEAPNLEDQAKAWLKTTRSKPGNVYLHAVHRLDRAVSGVVLFASTGKALSRLQAMQRRREIEKVYWAVVAGTPPETNGLLEHYLAHGHHRAEVVSPEHPGAKMAQLRYEVLDSGPGWSRLRIELVTGRYHQIRAQLAATGCPVLGDTRYGSPTPLPDRVIALHHAQMHFAHPVRREPVEIAVEPPAFWKPWR